MAQKLVPYLAVALLVVAVLLGLLVGPAELPAGELWAALWHGEPHTLAGEVLWSIRGPRVLAAAIAGAALSGAGVLLQGAMRNPLADPFLVGTSAGASVMAVAINIWQWPVVALGNWVVPAAAFAGALLAVAATLGIARATGKFDVLSILLSGMIVTAFCGAVTSFLMFHLDLHHLRVSLTWLMGGIGAPSGGTLALAGALLVALAAAALFTARDLNALLAGPAAAQAMGLDAGRSLRFAVLVAAALTAIAVALGGLIGFVGLLVPHVLRLVRGPDHRALIPLAFVFGAGFLVLSDWLARLVIAPAELPVGVLTSLCGAPLFLFLLVRYRRGAGS